MDANKIIFVTGATGNQGGAVARILAKNGFRVKALIRNPGSSKAVILQNLNITTLAGDLNNGESYREYLEDVFGVFSVQTFANGIEKEINQGITLANIAEEMGVKHFIYSSVLSADSHSDVSFMESKFKIENHIRNLKLPFTIIRPASLYENFLIPHVKKSILKGKLIQPINRDIVQQYISAEDIGKATLKIFKNSDSNLNKTMPLAAEQLSTQQIAETFSSVLNKKVEYKKLPSFITRLVMGKDLYKMFKWVNEKSVFYKEDVEITRKELPDYLPLKNWIEMNFTS